MPHTILVTGSNKGIGYEAVKLLAQEKPDSTILLGSRSIQNGEDAIKKMKASVEGHDFDNVRVLQIDVSDPASIDAAVQHVKSTYQTLDVLLHNSGIMKLNDDWMHPAVFDVNVRGAHDTIEAFTPILTPKKAMVVVVSSQVGPWYTHALPSETREKLNDIENVTWERVDGWLKDWDLFASGAPSQEQWVPVQKGILGSKYFASKALLNPYLRKYATLHPEIDVAVVCPGYCKTDLNDDGGGDRPASVGGASVSWPILNKFKSGLFYQDGVEIAYSYESPAFYRT
jgi:NAD(P)-dependent dehydrogenase (short-subunit alcohol dehydrogenase family)